MPLETFQLDPQAELEAEDAYAELRWNFGEGYEGQAFVGHSDGQRYYRFSYVAPNRTTHQVTDPEDMAVKTYAKYVRDFFGRRKVDGAAFYVDDPISGSAVEVTFVESSVVFKSIGKSTFVIQAQFRQHRTP